MLLSVGVPDKEVSVYSHVWRSAQSSAAVPPPATHRSAALRFLSYNTWNSGPPRWLWGDVRDRWRQYSLRMLHLAGVLRQASAGIVAFQEVRYDSSLGGASPTSGSRYRPAPLTGADADAAATAHSAEQAAAAAVPFGSDPRRLQAVFGAALAAAERAPDADPSTAAHRAPPAVGRGLPYTVPFAWGIASLVLNRTAEYAASRKYEAINRRKWAEVQQAARWEDFGAPHPLEGASAASAAPAALAGAEAAATEKGENAEAGSDRGRNPYTAAAAAATPRGPPDFLAAQRAMLEWPHAQIAHLAAFLPGYQFVFAPAQLYLDAETWRLMPAQAAPAVSAALADAAEGAHSVPPYSPRALPQQRDEEGPAIFSRWPIIASHSLLLSRNGSDPQDGHTRLVLHAAIDISGAVQRGGNGCAAEARSSFDAAAAASEAAYATPTPAAAEEPSLGAAGTGVPLVVDVYTVHLPLSEAARDRAVAEILPFIARTAAGAVQLLAGDMNAEPHERAMRALLERGRLVPLADFQPPAEGPQESAGASEGGDKTEGSAPLAGSPPGDGGERAGRPLPLLRDVWRLLHPEPEPRSPDAAARRFAFTFPCDDPVKRIDLVLAGAPEGAGVVCADVAEPEQGAREGAVEGAAGLGEGSAAREAAVGSDGTVRDPAPSPRAPDAALAAATSSKVCAARVSRVWLVGQDPLPATEEGEGKGLGMVSAHSPIWASDHRGVVVDLRVEG